MVTGSCSQGAWLGVWPRLTFGAVGHFIQVVESDPVQEVLLHQFMEEYIQTTVITDAQQRERERERESVHNENNNYHVYANRTQELISARKFTF